MARGLILSSCVAALLCGARADADDDRVLSLSIEYAVGVGTGNWLTLFTGTVVRGPSGWTLPTPEPVAFSLEELAAGAAADDALLVRATASTRAGGVQTALKLVSEGVGTLAAQARLECALRRSGRTSSFATASGTTSSSRSTLLAACGARSSG